MENVDFWLDTLKKDLLTFISVVDSFKGKEKVDENLMISITSRKLFINDDVEHLYDSYLYAKGDCFDVPEEYEDI